MWWWPTIKKNVYLILFWKITKTTEITGGGITKPSMTPNTLTPETKLWKTPDAFTKRFVKKSQKSHNFYFGLDSETHT